MKNEKGFSYIEVLMALAVLGMVIIPLLPAMTQARANYAYAMQAHHANAQAAHITLAMRAVVESSGHTAADPALQQAAGLYDNGFIYRVGIYEAQTQPEGIFYMWGDESPSILPQPQPVDFITDSEYFKNNYIIITEVFDREGSRMGISVGLVNP